MGFPLFALLAMMAIGRAGRRRDRRPRLRLSGGSFRRRLRLGWRRVVLDSGPLVAVLVSAGLATGCFTVASALAAGADRQLADKATVYVGSRSGGRRATTRSRSRPTGGAGDDGLQASGAVTATPVPICVGVDRSQFGDVATLRHDGAIAVAGRSVAAIAPVGCGSLHGDRASAASSAVGDVVDVRGARHDRPLPVEVVATASFFPGKTHRRCRCWSSTSTRCRRGVAVRRGMRCCARPARGRGDDDSSAGRADRPRPRRDAGVRRLRRTAPCGGRTRRLPCSGVLFAVVASGACSCWSCRRGGRSAGSPMPSCGARGSRRVACGGLRWSRSACRSWSGPSMGVVAAVVRRPAVDRASRSDAGIGAAGRVRDAVERAARCGVRDPDMDCVIAWSIVRSTVRADPMRVFQGSADEARAERRPAGVGRLLRRRDRVVHVRGTRTWSRSTTSSLKVGEGELVAIAGPSGSGKSTHVVDPRVPGSPDVGQRAGAASRS